MQSQEVLYSPRQTHHMDDGVLVLSSLNEIRLTKEAEFKGGLLENIMPEEVRSFFLQVPDKELSQLFQKLVDIKPETGKPDWSQYPDIFPTCVTDFINAVSYQFDVAYPGECQFGFQGPRAQIANDIFPRFHFDTRSNEPEATFRGLISVSADSDNHETEWVATNGLSQDDLINKFRGVNKPFSEMDDDLKSRIQVLGSGGLLIFKGLSREKQNVLIDAMLHRSPPYKNHYSNENIRRVGLVWNKKIKLVEQNMG